MTMKRLNAVKSELRLLEFSMDDEKLFGSVFKSIFGKSEGNLVRVVAKLFEYL